MIKPAYGYCRVSGKKQIDGHGFARQQEAIEKFCKGNGFKVERIFKEQVSGVNDETERPEFTAMVSDILSNGVKTIIVESLDRLAREYRIQEQLLIYLTSKGIELITANTGENVTQAISDDPMKKAMVQIQGVFAELDKSLLVRKLAKARRKVRDETGRCEGIKPYGTFEGEAEIQKFCRYARRQPKNPKQKKRAFREIAEALNEQGFKTRQGKDWNAMLVRNIIVKKP